MESPETGKVRKEIIHTLKLGAPIVAAQLMQMSMNVADTIMAGHFSAEALAAIAVGNSLWVPLLLFVLGILLVINPIVAQLFGSGKKEQIGKNLWQGLWLGLFLSLPCFFMVRNMSLIMDFFNIQAAIIPTTLGYLEAISWSVPAQFCYFALRFFNEGIHITKPSMYFAIIGSVLNIFANYVYSDSFVRIKACCGSSLLLITSADSVGSISSFMYSMIPDHNFVHSNMPFLAGFLSSGDCARF